MTFSPSDVSNTARLYSTHGNGYVVAGTYIFALIVYDPAKAKKVDPDQIRKKFEDARDDGEGKGTIQENAEAGVIAAIKGTGIAYYKAKNPEKPEQVVAKLVSGGE